MFLFEVKRLIWSALKIEFFELYFLQPVLGGHPSLLLRRFVFRMAEANAERVTGDELQGTMGRAAVTLY